MPRSGKPIPRKPRPPRRSGWIRKSDLDARLDRFLPIPTQIVSNEEFAPPPQSPELRAVERLLAGIAAERAERLGMDRRAFLRTGAGMAAGFMALNAVFGDFFTVGAAEVEHPDKAEAAAGARKFFVMDVQTHHVEAAPAITEADRKFFEYLNMVRGFGGQLNPDLSGKDARPEHLHQENFIKEIFLDSETDVAVISGLPQWSRNTYPLKPESIAKTRDLVNELAGSRRALGQAILSPELGSRNLELMQSQAENLKLSSWKGYPGQPLGPNGEGWWMDDEKTSYPALEMARKLGIRNVALHKGLPAPGFSAEHCNPKDIYRAAKDFPDINFLVYHGGFRSVQEMIPAIQSEFTESSEVPWVSDLCRWKEKNPDVTNVYMELGSTFGMTAIGAPLLCGHILGMILKSFGDDHLLWGTDAVWWGSPQWQIEAFKRFKMPESLKKRFGYADLTDEVRAKVLGLNAAKVYGVDVEAVRKPIPDDFIDRLKKTAAAGGGTLPSNTQYGWVRA